ncbi:DEAD H (Asp-Glu-Ala-Asp His) box helicase 11 [Rhizophlyctis rosea]|nr:DEAD H (Asp-Glu-Ala-Asp His) box helicase 11 [Rhizophlyctis rosea]
MLGNDKTTPRGAASDSSRPYGRRSTGGTPSSGMSTPSLTDNSASTSPSWSGPYTPQTGFGSPAQSPFNTPPYAGQKSYGYPKNDKQPVRSVAGAMRGQGSADVNVTELYHQPTPRRQATPEHGSSRQGVPRNQPPQTPSVRQTGPHHQAQQTPARQTPTASTRRQSITLEHGHQAQQTPARQTPASARRQPIAFEHASSSVSRAAAQDRSRLPRPSQLPASPVPQATPNSLRRARSETPESNDFVPPTGVPLQIGGRQFNFPFPPWEIQKLFMSNLYNALEGSKVGVFESPTGTGKSLSLICGSLKWLRDHQNRTEEQLVDEYLERQKAQQAEQGFPTIPDDPSDAAFGDEWDLNRKREEAKSDIRAKRQRKQERAVRLQRMRREEQEQRATDRRYHKKVRTEAFKRDNENEQDNEFLVDDYESDGGNRNPYLRRKVNMDVDEESSSGEDDDYEEIQILYCSRTHSQVMQFISEIEKTVYQDIKTVSLGSRKTLCINDSVTKLGTLPRINDKCLDLQKEPEKKRCEYKATNKATSMLFADKIHAAIHDIEDIADVGKRMGICPYYGGRDAVKSSEIVAMPYPILMQKASRESFGIRVKGNIVIIDEAHNIVDAITALHTVELSLPQVTRAHTSLNNYLERYKTRLKGANVQYIRQILNLLKAFERVLTPPRSVEEPKFLQSNALEGTARPEPRSVVMSVTDFVHDSNIDNINTLKLQKYLDESRLAQKLQGFAEKHEGGPNVPLNHEPDNEEFVPRHVSALQEFQQFLPTLSNPGRDGRIVITRQAGSGNTKNCTLKYLLLNPADSFSSIVQEARAVILAGGTMGPVSQLKLELFPSLPNERFTHFSCDHVIPQTSLLTLAVQCGPGGHQFKFNYENRNSADMINDAGKALAKFCDVIPDGIVCFFPSFDYMDKVQRTWRNHVVGKGKGTQGASVWNEINSKKEIFVESKIRDGDSVLARYTHKVTTSTGRGKPDEKTGAILFAVVGGKLSEGINFSDHLGRAVVMFGLPYPPKNSPEVQEKLNFIANRAAPKHPAAAHEAGEEYYHNMAMKGVNQSIGRAIRHKNDYAVVLLLDERYTQHRVSDRLPHWIRQCRMETPAQFEPAVDHVRQFFKQKQTGIMDLEAADIGGPSGGGPSGGGPSGGGPSGGGPSGDVENAR